MCAEGACYLVKLQAKNTNANSNEPSAESFVWADNFLSEVAAGFSSRELAIA